MIKSLHKALDFLRSFTRNYLPLMYEVAVRLIDLRMLGTSWAARLSRVWGARVLIVVGVAATAYAAVLFALHGLGPETPSSAHDTILRSRFSSPPPSTQVVIVDIDERSLALLAPDYGRWPWPRSVLADGVQKLSDLGARAVVLNVLVSDPDKAQPDADAALEATAALVRAAAFPMVRLNPDNDGSSQLRVAAIAGAQDLSAGGQRTVAAILPLFGTMHDRLGVANQRPDADGIVRSYPLVWTEPQLRLPSLVGRALEVGGVSGTGLPERLPLNWRNKQGSYQRLSFADLLQAPAGDPRLTALKDAWVVVGASAPGVGQTKPTSVQAVADDNEILATALDDALSGSWLRLMPHWLTFLINVGAIWVLVALALGKIRRGAVTQAFVIAQSGFGAITLLSASYTHYLIDLSQSMSFGLAVFGVIKIVQGLETGWLRARPGLRRVDAQREYHGTLAVIGLVAQDVAEVERARLVRELEALVGVSRIIRVDDLLGGESFLKGACAGMEFLLVLAEAPQQAQIDDALARSPVRSQLRLTRHALTVPWKPDDPALAQALAPLVLESAAALLRTRP